MVSHYFANRLSITLNILCIANYISASIFYFLVCFQPKVGDKDEMNLISEHAGFLLALGLNGHLSNLARLSLHDYLIKVSTTYNVVLLPKE